MATFPRFRTGTMGVIAASAALAMMATTTSAYAAAPAAAPAAPAAVVAAAPGGSFSTSFETGQPQPALSTPDLNADGSPRQQNVSGTVSADGSLLGAVVGVTASAENGPGEVAANLADANPDTKWLTFATTGWVRYQLSKASTVVRYSLTSANDAPERDPKNFTLEGSNDGTAWTTLDTVSGNSFTARFQAKSFDVDTPGSYTYYRLNVAANQSGGIIQLADWDISDGSTGGGSITPMGTFVGAGPISGYNVKPLAGWTGVKAMRYAGGHVADGRGYAFNKLFDVNVPVGDTSELSYKIIPDFIAGDLSYPSTNTAIDLHFTDGTYLSDLGATDSHDVAASPSGQGAGKILYAAQWNSVVIPLGAKAAGKTVDRILVGYDNPTASATTRFGGWIDDLTINPDPTVIDRSRLTNFVDTRRGTNSSGSFSRGNNLPITAVPNGFNFFTPQTDANSQSWQYSYQAANNAQNLPVLQGIGISHEPSPWMGDRNQVSFMPSTSATPTGSASGRAVAFDHKTEIAQPDYYRASLANGVTVETAPTDHGGTLRFTYPATATSGSFVIDTVDNNGAFTIDAASRTLTGWVDNGSGLSAGRSRMFIQGTIDAPVTATGTAASGHTGTRYARLDVSATKQVTVRLSTSFISLAQAQKNLDLEVTGKSLDDVRALANRAWQARLGVVGVEGASQSDKVTLYSNLYRLNLYPNSQSENTGTAAAPQWRYASPVQPTTGAATATQSNAKLVDGKIYVNNGFWDTYRTAWPAYSLLYPEFAAEIADGFVQQYRDGGWIARWSSPGYADLMTGTSSDVAFADAFVKGVPLPDKAGTYAAALKNATVLPTSNAVGRKGLATSSFLGYTANTTGESVSWGLEGLVNDFGIGNQAKALAADPATPAAQKAQLLEESEYFLKRSTDYINLFSKDLGFFAGRSPDGAFPATLDPEAWGGYYTETNAWNFAFHAPQDGNGLANLYGGRDGLATKLDTFFSTPETATKPGGYGGTIHEMLEARDVRMGQFGMSNQVSHHIPYMYNYTGQQWKTAEKVREVMQRLYVGDEIGQGYPGDEDNGEMSSWYTLSALGLYPLQVGSENWTIGSPKFTKAVVHRTQGDLTINANGNSATNIYVQSLKVNGTATTSTSVPQSALKGTARLDFTMGASPSAYGSSAADAPPSLTTGDALPNPLKDTLAADRGTLTVTDGAASAAGGALLDNDSRTATTFATATPTLQWKNTGLPQTVEWYTLTNGAAAGDPSAWRLEGSQNGKTWKVLDERKNQAFPWRTQTRPFKVAAPKSYLYYRLVVTATTGAATPTLSEIELLTGTEPTRGAPLGVQARGDAELSVGQELSGKLATFSGGEGGSAEGYSATIAWGDGTSGPGTIAAGELGSYTVSGSHAWSAAGPYTVIVTVTDGTNTRSASFGVVVHSAIVPSYASGFDSDCISTVGAQVGCDGQDAGISAEGLAAKGVVPGKLVTVPGTDLRWSLPGIPAGQPDNATGAGQTLPVTLAPGASKLSLIGTATERGQQVTTTVNFTDGTSAPYAIAYADWCQGPAAGTVVAVQTDYRLKGTGTDGCRPSLFATAPFEIPAGKTVASVTLPLQPGSPTREGRIHVFAIADNGAAMTVTPGANVTAKQNRAVQVTLGTVSGGTVGAGGYTARVAWGDGVTEDATITVGANGVATLSGMHTWSKGTYTVRVLVADERSDALITLTATIG